MGAVAEQGATGCRHVEAVSARLFKPVLEWIHVGGFFKRVGKLPEQVADDAGPHKLMDLDLVVGLSFKQLFPVDTDCFASQVAVQQHFPRAAQENPGHGRIVMVGDPAHHHREGVYVQPGWILVVDAPVDPLLVVDVVQQGEHRRLDCSGALNVFPAVIRRMGVHLARDPEDQGMFRP